MARSVVSRAPGGITRRSETGHAEPNRCFGMLNQQRSAEQARETCERRSR
jgi:hypothetical protein